MKLINDNFDDYFEGNAPSRKNNEPYVETEEEREERELNETTIERRSKRKRIALIIGAIILLLLIIFILRGCYFNHQESSVKGIITDIALKGTVFKTYEGTLNQITVPAEGVVEKKDFNFSVTDDSIAKTLNELKQTPVAVQLSYKEYKSAVPWRGDSKFVVYAIDTVRVPEYINTIDKYNSNSTMK